MKILILGGTGMLGHNFFNAWSASHIVKITVRGTKEHYFDNNGWKLENSYFGINALSNESLKAVFDEFCPDAVINAIGITKQLT